MEENTMKNCLFCYKHLDLNWISNRRLEAEDTVYHSCCELINRDSLGEGFFKWSHPTPLPFCPKCLLYAQKLSRMNAKLQEVQSKIGKLIKKFTSEFLRQRESNIISAEYSDPSSSCKTFNNNNTKEGDNDNGSDTLVNEEDNFYWGKVDVKKECDDSADGSVDSDSQFNDYPYEDDDNDFIEKKPDLTKLILSVGKELSKNSVKRKKLTKSRRAAKLAKPKKRKVNSEANHTLIGHVVSRPRRNAALKAAEMFSSFNKEHSEEEDDENVDQSDISEESSVASDSYSEVDENEKAFVKGAKRGYKRSLSYRSSSNLKCTYCKEVFHIDSDLQHHLPIHNDERPFECDKCTLRFASERFLAVHRWKHFSDKFFKCGHCTKSYKYLHCLKDHVKSRKHHKKGKTSSECKLCEEAIATGSELLRQKKIELGYVPALSKADLDCSTEEGGFKCDNCSLSFKTEKFLSVHSCKHARLKIFKCGHCDSAYKYSNGLKEHVKSQGHHGENEDANNPCSLCDEAMAAGKEILRQKTLGNDYVPPSIKSDSLKSIKNEDRPFSCDKCSLRFTTQKFLSIHTWKHLSDKFFKCGHCEKNYKYMHCLKDHVKGQGHHKGDPDPDLPCLLCEEAISKGKELLLQKKIENGYVPSEDNSSFPKELKEKIKVKRKEEKVRKKREKPLYVCPECGKNCPGKSEVFYHRFSHQPPGTEINCQECNEPFKDILTLQKHTVDAHPKTLKIPGETKIVICPVCGKMLRGSLSKHMYLHSEVKQFPCPICEKRFSTRSALTAHSVYHQKDRPYLCEECGQGFHTGTKLREHYRIHTGMLLYCPHCPKGFRNSTHLKQHSRVHSKHGTQPVLDDTEEEKYPTEVNTTIIFECAFCQQSFQTEDHLNNHMSMHTEHSLLNLVAGVSNI